MAHRRLAVTHRAHPLRRRPVLAVGATLALSIAGLPASTALAQSSAPPAAAQTEDPAGALERARASLEEARGAPGPRHPDATAWRTALTEAQDALAAASGTDLEAEALALLARVYGEVRWWSRALDVWNRLEEHAGELEPEALRAWRDAASQVAFARYGRGDLEGAERGFRAILERDPADTEALAWLGRIALESGRPADAVDAYSRLVERAPDDAGARFQLELARERSAYGTEASEAHRRGIALYEAGDVAGAVEAFAAAHAAAPGWSAPARWRARTLLELGRSEAAADAWAAILDANPDDADAAWFLERARLEARVGREAALAADDARAAREAGEPEEALEAWRRAVDAAPDWTEAQLSLARAALEAGEPEAARGAYRAVLEQEPGDEAARAEAEAGLERVELHERLGPEAGPAYSEALEAYERNDMERAEERLRHAVEHAPEFADAWGWLGRLAFSRGDWAAAADAYERASELEPGDDDYAFFGQEARRLAGPTETSGAAGEGASGGEEP